MTITRIHRPRNIMVKGSKKITEEGDRNGMVVYGSMDTGELGKHQRDRMTKVRDNEKTTFSDLLRSILYEETT